MLVAHNTNFSVRLFLTSIAALAFLLLSCREAAIEPQVPPKNPRDYTWTMDTLVVPGQLQNMILSIWGSSANDVYAVGRNSGNQETIFHFDGKSWGQLYPLRDLHINQSRFFELDAIIGFSPNDIWISGSEYYDNHAPPPNFLDSSVVFHYNGYRGYGRICREEKQLAWSVCGVIDRTTFG